MNPILSFFLSLWHLYSLHFSPNSSSHIFRTIFPFILSYSQGNNLPSSFFHNQIYWIICLAFLSLLLYSNYHFLSHLNPQGFIPLVLLSPLYLRFSLRISQWINPSFGDIILFTLNSIGHNLWLFSPDILWLWQLWRIFSQLSSSISRFSSSCSSRQPLSFMWRVCKEPSLMPFLSLCTLWLLWLTEYMCERLCWS